MKTPPLPLTSSRTSFLARRVGDVLAEHDDARIALHLVAHARVQEVHHRRRLRALGEDGLRRERVRRGIDVGRVDEVVGGLGGGKRSREGAVRRLVDLAVDVFVQPLELGLLEDPLGQEELRKEAHRIPLGVAVALLLRAVHRLVVGEGVAVGPDDVGVNERRTLPRAAVLRRVAQRVVGLEEVAPVDLGEEEVRKAAQELRDRAARRVDLDGDRDRVAVVLDQEEDGELQVAGRGEGFPELALGGLPLPARDDDDLVGVEAALLRRARGSGPCASPLRRADGVEELGPGAGGLGDQVQPLGAPVRGHLPSRGGRVVLRADGLEEHLVGGHPELQAEGPVAVVELEPVVAGPGDHPGGRRDRLVAGAVDLEVDLVLPLELDLLVVDPPGEVDVAVGGDERGVVQAVVFARRDLRRHGRKYSKRGREAARAPGLPI